MTRWYCSILLIALVVSGCGAARGPRAKAQVAALNVGEAVLSIDQAERTVYTSAPQGYTKADHDQVGAVILKALYASRAFERAVAAWPADGTPTNTAVEQAKAGLEAALADIGKAIPAANPARGPIMAAVAAAQAAVAAWRAN